MITWFIDTETCGLHGIPILLQYAEDDGPVNLHHIFNEPIGKTLELIERIVSGRVVAHNLRFDWFHLSKIFNMLCAMDAPLHVKPSQFTTEELVEFEYEARNGYCLKPAEAVDTLLLAQKGEFQSSLMNAKPIYVRQVPKRYSEELLHLLEHRTDLPWILRHKWDISDRVNQEGDVDDQWVDLVLRFKPSNSLKDLAQFLCDHEPPKKFDEIMPEIMPIDEGYAPYATLLTSRQKDWMYQDKPTWPAIYKSHINHWRDNEAAIAYATDDIAMLRKLYKYFGSPENDQDAIIACQVASVRLRGFAVDLESMQREHDLSTEIIQEAKINVNSPKQVKGFVAEALDPMEQVILANGCDKKVIDQIRIEFTLDEEEECECDESVRERYGVCPRCEGKGTVGPGPMPVVKRVEHVDRIRRHRKRVELYDKLLLAGRAYPDFKVIGTKSGRLSGASGLNFQGIDHSPEVRSLFTLANEGEVLCAGDYSSQEVAIAATTMNDEKLMVDMQSGKSLHALFGAELYGVSYEQMIEWKKAGDQRYNDAKSGVFLTLYGGTVDTLARNLGIPIEQAQKAFDNMTEKYPQMGNTRAMISERFSSLQQNSDGKINYSDPPEKFIESVFGYRRYFETEYLIQSMILDVLHDLPDSWNDPKYRVERKSGRIQTIGGCISSALYGAAFSIQNKIIRAANNHVIQSTGRELTVGMQAEVWKLQPQGIHPFKLTLMSIHDELAVVSKPELVDTITETIRDKVEQQRKYVPLTAIDWYTHNHSWEEKGFGQNKHHIGWKPGEELSNAIAGMSTGR